MPRQKRDSHLYELAKRGAEIQLRDLLQEAKYLVELFPHLRDSFDEDELPLSFILAAGAGRSKTVTTGTRSRRRTSPAARKAAGGRMKKYGAARRKLRKA